MTCDATGYAPMNQLGIQPSPWSTPGWTPSFRTVSGFRGLVDERDRPGGQVTFVGEENITVDADAAAGAFPLQHPLVPALLIRWEG